MIKFQVILEDDDIVIGTWNSFNSKKEKDKFVQTLINGLMTNRNFVIVEEETILIPNDLSILVEVL